MNAKEVVTKANAVAGSPVLWLVIVAVLSGIAYNEIQELRDEVRSVDNTIDMVFRYVEKAQLDIDGIEWYMRDIAEDISTTKSTVTNIRNNMP